MVKYKYLFIGNIPLLVEEKNMSRQLMVEFFFSDDISRDFSIDVKPITRIEGKKNLDYIV